MSGRYTSRTTGDIKLNANDASTSSADGVIVEDWVEENEDNDNYASAESVISDTPVQQDNASDSVVKPDSTVSVKAKGKPQKPVKSVKQPDRCICSCGNILKDQTCFNCGIPGHIARNCPHRPYVSNNGQGWQNVPRGKSSKRNPSRSRSCDGDWNAKKAKKQTPSKPVDKKVQKDKPVKSVQKPNPQGAFTKPKWVKSKSPKGSSPVSHLKHKPKAKGVSIPKSSEETPIRLNQNKLKPNYRWVLKRLVPNQTPAVFNSLSDKQDMILESVVCVDVNGKTSVRMDWVPKLN
ncbi:hypothetical protein E9993_22800 [Labilibacter sediminis]|nr:hypothetical protein E9993_22800 [Labilibacter sediminis]